MENTENAEEKDKYRYGNVEPILRKGKKESDADYARLTRVWIDFYRDKQAEFAAFDPMFTIAFADNWTALCDAFIKAPSDETMKDGLYQATLDVQEAQKPVLELADELQFFVKKAFPKQPRVLDEFGFKLLRATSGKTNLKFTLYGYTVLPIYQYYETELLAAGLPAAWVTNFDNAIGEAGDKEIRQEVAKRLRIRATTKRVELYNALYEQWQAVYDASRVIYKNQPEVMKWWNW